MERKNNSKNQWNKELFLWKDWQPLSHISEKKQRHKLIKLDTKKQILPHIQLKSREPLGNTLKNLYSNKMEKNKRNGCISRHIWPAKTEPIGNKQSKQINNK
jgi:predicted transcriptional regulator